MSPETRQLTRERFVPGLSKVTAVISAGCWTIGGPAANHGVPIGWDGVDPEAAAGGLARAYELGVRHFDTADVYGMGQSERLLGKLIAQVPRDSISISSKVGYRTSSKGVHPYHPAWLRKQCYDSLARLGTDHLDAYFLHNLDFGAHDEYLPAAMTTLTDLRREGVIRAIGMRAPHEFAEQWASGPPSKAQRQAARFVHVFSAVHPNVITVRHNLLSYDYGPQEADIFAFAREHRIGVLIKQALGQGLLLGKHDPDGLRRFSTLDHRSADPTFAPHIVREVNNGLAAALAQLGGDPSVLLRAAIGHATRGDLYKGTTVLVGFRNAAQIAATVNAVLHPLTLDGSRIVHRALQPARTMLHANLFTSA
ncbi:aldo/keto reductase [Actinoplanes sp. NPDC051859]|uniref:aldo/keto reductase n=1 Tax=Actinoplanes sp. NPDC051859 TaxID=3363909 RepID=UPI0037A00138